MIVDKIESCPCWDGGAEIRLHTRDLSAVQALMDKYIDGKEYTAEIKRKRVKRSLDANAYCWVLCKKIADVIRCTDEEVYKNCIRSYGVSDIRPVRKDAADSLCDMWDKQGLGNSHTVIGDAKIDGYVNIKFYWGSSQYNSADMARLIDGIVSDCHELDIETMTPNEIARLKEAWK